MRKPGNCSVFFKIQSNNECQEAWMTFGAVKAIKVALELRVCYVNPAVVREMETSSHWPNKQW